MTKSNTVQHQNMSKTRHQNGTKNNNNTSSQMLLDHYRIAGYFCGYKFLRFDHRID